MTIVRTYNQSNDVAITDAPAQIIRVFEAVVMDTGGGGAVDSVNGKTGAVVLTPADTGAQPADSDLTAIAALTTTTFGRALLALADAAALRTAGGLGTAATQASTAFDAAGAAAAAQAASQPLDSDLTAIAALATTAFGRSLLTAADAAAARSTLGAGTSSFDGAYSSLTGKPTLGTAAASATTDFDAAGAAASAQSTAEAYTDTAVAGLVPNTRTVAGHALSANVTLVKGDVGLGNVDNTADTAKPVSTAQQTALDLKLAKASNLSDVASASTARTNLGLGTAATVDTGTSSGNIPLLSTGGRLPIARIASGTPDGTKFVRDDGTLVTPSGSGGGLAASYLGKNAIGASWFTIATQGTFKKITTTGAATLLGVEAYLRAAADTVGSIGYALFSDNAGTPGLVLSYAGQGFASDTVAIEASTTDNAVNGGGTGRWFALPITYQLAAATSYWVGIFTNDYTAFQIAYDTSGSDLTWTSGGAWLADWARYTGTSTTRDHSIRANVLA